MPFKNREHAARQLAERLSQYRGKNPLVLAIPRGAAPMAKIIADTLGGDMDVVLVRKLGAPGNEEFALGSIDETGHVYLGERIRELGISEHYLETEKQAQLKTLRQRRAQYTPVRPPIDPAGRIVIVVDDGIATGATMIAALRAVRGQKPAKLIAAAAVAPGDNLQKIKKEADAVVCLEVPPEFYAVGAFFREFPQVSDDEVIEMLRQARHPQQTNK